jgi:hypothetical protein
VFWFYAVLGGILVSTLSTFGLNAADSAGVRAVGIALSLLIVFLGLAYYAWAIVSLWRCAFNVRRHLWGYLARAYAVAQTALIAYALASTSWVT